MQNLLKEDFEQLKDKMLKGGAGTAIGVGVLAAFGIGIKILIGSGNSLTGNFA